MVGVAACIMLCTFTKNDSYWPSFSIEGALDEILQKKPSGTRRRSRWVACHRPEVRTLRRKIQYFYGVRLLFFQTGGNRYFLSTHG